MRVPKEMLGVVRFVLRGLLLLGAFMAAHELMTRGPLGHHVRNFEYALLQEALIGDYWSKHPARPSELPLVLDISYSIPANQDAPTDRKKLDELLQEICQYSPTAIGVDIDFSPSSTLQDPLDWMYFNRWKSLKTPEGKPVQVRLGVYRRANDAPHTWLGRGEFDVLAAGVAKPSDRQLNYFQILNPGNNNENKDPLLQMAASLDAATRGTDSAESVAHLRSNIDTKATKLRNQYGTYVVDFSSLDEIQNHRTFIIPTKFPLSGCLRILQEKIQGNIVLIGAVEHADDKFPLAHRDDPVPGVFIQACSLVTLREGALKHIDGWWGKVADLLLAGLALAIVATLGTLSVFQRINQKLNFHNVEMLLTSLMAAGVFLASTWLIGGTRIFWPDFLWVSLSLAAHPFLSNPLWRLCRRSVGAVGSFIMDFITQRRYAHDKF